jgi:hypothetical protein
VSLQGGESLSDYVFLHEDSLHSFCKICGVSVLVKVLSEGEGDDICPINVRTIRGIGVGKLRLRRYDGRGKDPQYVVGG